MNEDEHVGLFPPILSIVCFLFASVAMTASIGLTGGMLLRFYFSLSSEVELLLLSISACLFVVVNYQVVLGSFYAVKVLKRVLLISLLLLIPVILSKDFDLLVLFSCAIFIFVSIYLLSHKHYLTFVNHRKVSVEDQKEALSEIAAELEAKKNK
ncbi:hypothetical protein Q4591_10525 [Shewanella sp. 3_MG-2023]|uniref:hypothetical protein n=1 Tax=Shewanella sp. 3_MG-2023 TaxID=3062635 RepID=UPI0026E236A3|nr:hypothetical protein [Shewanella sp. 3_MG-2023]MDO6775793.1 hypothetical protein [Shewanella sp. 3_MG-2023]